MSQVRSYSLEQLVVVERLHVKRHLRIQLPETCDCQGRDVQAERRHHPEPDVAATDILDVADRLLQRPRRSNISLTSKNSACASSVATSRPP